MGKYEIERLRRVNEQLTQEIDRLREGKEAVKKNLRKVEKEFEEYMSRLPKNVGEKNGKPYIIKHPARIDSVRGLEPSRATPLIIVSFLSASTKWSESLSTGAHTAAARSLATSRTYKSVPLKTSQSASAS